jgi:aspartyl-tRNA(Asn)/glutamyl-tRNA(Gln) amidotransferase subunit B
VENALTYEIERQKGVIEDGREPVQETRLWDEAKGVTVSMRGKEEAHDYRYFPDPDLLPLVIDEGWIEEIRSTLPELPDEKRARFIEAYGIPLYDAQVLTSSRSLADYFEACVEHFSKPKTVSNWVMGSILATLKAENKTIEESPVSPERLAELLRLVDSGVISGKIAKTVFDEMVSSGKPPEAIVQEKGLVQVTDADAITEVIEQVLSDHAKEVSDYRAGKTKLFGFFVGQVMKATRGKANPKMVNEILKSLLE